MSCRSVVLVVLSFLCCLTLGAKEASAQWKSQDPGCSGLNRPSLHGPEDLERFLNWFDKCSGSTQPDIDTGDPPCDWDVDRTYTYTENGRCYRVVVHCLHNRLSFYVRPCIKQVFPPPFISALTITSEGYTAEVAASSRNTNKQVVRPGQVSLVNLVRAMMHGAKLPSNDITKVSQEFWANQKNLTLKSSR